MFFLQVRNIALLKWTLKSKTNLINHITLQCHKVHYTWTPGTTPSSHAFCVLCLDLWCMGDTSFYVNKGIRWNISPMHCIIKTHRQKAWDDGVAPNVEGQLLLSVMTIDTWIDHEHCIRCLGTCTSVSLFYCVRPRDIGHSDEIISFMKILGTVFKPTQLDGDTMTKLQSQDAFDLKCIMSHQCD